MAKTKVVRETAKWRRSGAKGLKDRSRLREESQKSVLSSFLDLFWLSNAKRATRRAFLEGGLVSLTLRTRTVF